MRKANTKNYYVIWALVSAVLSVGISMVIFYYRFNFKFDAPMKNWVEFAIYFNNLLSPIFLLITVFLLYWTWRDTKEGLELQRQDALYASIIGTLERSSVDVKQHLMSCKVVDLEEKTIMGSIEQLGNYYLISRQEKEKDSTTELSFNNRVEFIDKIRISSTQVSSYSSLIRELYNMLDINIHQTCFRLNLYSQFSVEFLVGFLLTQIRTIHLIEELEKSDTSTIQQSINILKDTITVSTKNKDLSKELFNDLFINEFFKKPI
ncbi:hypothetical protein Q4596_00480 [Pseudoalteromonas carrageenovora]|uniref:hypothetical protein n=1 Tax=Pseudoalteromonas carrageenovora TaxID=227 RepID=UPI0026E1D19E|nr:hypothetical protein [Pseudoalteromonas carrageenovora]MDO6834074.1 hypothetical protein [Pseudoalteromonas carrageenovora]